MAEERSSFFRYCFPRSLWPLWDRRTVWAMMALLALVGGLYLWQAGEIAVAVHHVQELQTEVEALQRKNAEAQREITELTRVGVLTGRAQALGFTGPSGDMYVNLRADPLADSAIGTTDE